MLLRTRGLSKSFTAGSGWSWGRDQAPVRALVDIDLELHHGECLAVVGESGSGKTTLARLLMRLDAADSGTLEFDGTDLLSLTGGALRRQRRRFQMVFQDPFGSLNPRMKVGTAIAEPLKIHHIVPPSGVKKRVLELLKMVGLESDVAERYPHQFSGGQRQRIGIARALATEPDLLIADEPVSALDVSVQAQVLNLLMDLRQELGLTMLFITHDMAVVRQVADRVAVLYLGRIVEQGPADAVLEDAAHPYTQCLLDSVPYPDPSRARLRTAAQGEPPDPAHPPTGCAFHPRCPRAEQQCRERIPELVASNEIMGGDSDPNASLMSACFLPGRRTEIARTTATEKSAPE